MSIRPVDLQVLIPHATDVGKSQHVADKSLTTQQQQFAEQWQEISANRQQKVQNAPKVEGSKVRRDKEKQEKEKGHDNHGRDSFIAKKEQAKQACGQLSGLDPARGHLIDIKT